MRKRLRLAVFLQLHTGFGLGLLRGLAQFGRRHPHVELLKFPKPARFQPFELRTLKLDGIVAKISTRDDETVLAGLGIPVVNVSGQIATPRLHALNTDDVRVGEMAFGHFFRRGHRAVAYCGEAGHRASQLRLQGLARAASAAGIPCVACPLKLGGEAPAGSAGNRRRLGQWLQQLPRPAGVLAFTDRLAIELTDAAGAAGLRVPEDLAILGVGNDLTRLDFAHTEISSIELPAQQIGYRSAELLLELIAGKKEQPREDLFSPRKIVTRRSTERYAVNNETVAAALDHIRENLGNTIYVPDIARAAGLSRRALELRFQQTLGESIYGVVQRLRSERVQELLDDPSLSLSEIAYTTGYTDGRHLSIAFRRTMGVSPSRFRQKLNSG